MSAPIGTQYSANQLQRALDAAARGEQAQERVHRWRTVLNGILSGKLSVGSREPVPDYPEWVTLEVVTGGFATGAAQAGGPLLHHETALLNELGLSDAEFPRLELNRYFLSEAGLDRLQHAIKLRRFVIDVAEEAALPIVAWLLAQGHIDVASQLVQTLAPFAKELRFYPRLGDAEPAQEGSVHLETAGMVVQRLRSIGMNQQILAQREAVGIWTPLYDTAVGLTLETIDGSAPHALKDEHGGWLRGDRGQFVISGGWPFKSQPADWSARVYDLIKQIDLAQSQHRLCKRFSRVNEPFMVLATALRKAADTPAGLTAREVGLVRLIVARYLTKRSEPSSPAAQAQRALQSRHAIARTHQNIAFEVADRLATYPASAGLDDIESVLSISESQAAVKPDAVPFGVLRRLQRCVKDSPDGLIQRGVVTSAEVLAKLLPQRTSELSAASIHDASLRVLYAMTYRAFRRRRSLLLLNLQKQVQIEELPWIAAMNQFRDRDASAAYASSEALEEFATVAIARFPQTMLPNKLLQEFSMLAQQAGKTLPFTEELATDIFMGQFSPKFVEAAMIAARCLQGSLYESYYRLSYLEISNRLSSPHTVQEAAKALVAICAERSGESIGTWRPASNGRIIEQQLIITSHNLALLIELQGVRERLADQLPDLVKTCYAWLLSHLQLPHIPGDWRTDLHRIKNAAYAWRQMVFLLSLTTVRSKP